jgi:hypothetical protein
MAYKMILLSFSVYPPIFFFVFYAVNVILQQIGYSFFPERLVLFINTEAATV